MHFDLSLDLGSRVDRDALGHDVADHHGGLFQVDPFGRLYVAFQLALHDHGAGSNVGFQAAVRADGQPVAFRIDTAFDLAVDVEISFAGNLTFDDERLANEDHPGNVRWRCHEAGLLRSSLRAR